MSGAGKKVADVAFKASRTLDWDGMAKVLVSDEARKEFSSLRRAFDEVNTQLQTKFSQEPEPIDWELYRKSIGSGIVDMYKEAYDKKPSKSFFKPISKVDKIQRNNALKTNGGKPEIIQRSSQDHLYDNPDDYKEKTELEDIVLIKNMLIGELDYGVPDNILLISSDVDFAKFLLALKERGFTVLLAENGYANEKFTMTSWYWDQDVPRKKI